MSLREQLGTAMFTHIDEEGATFDVVEITDAVLVTAAWLRDEAADMRTRVIYRRGLPEELERLADKIDPPAVTP